MTRTNYSLACFITIVTKIYCTFCYVRYKTHTVDTAPGLDPNQKQTWSVQTNEHAHSDGIYPFPAVMQTRTIETNGTSIHVRVGGHGPAVVMLRGFGTTGDMWGSSGERTHRRPHDHRARPAWARPLVEA